MGWKEENQKDFEKAKMLFNSAYNGSIPAFRQLAVFPNSCIKCFGKLACAFLAWKLDGNTDVAMRYIEAAYNVYGGYDNCCSSGESAVYGIVKSLYMEMVDQDYAAYGDIRLARSIDWDYVNYKMNEFYININKFDYLN